MTSPDPKRRETRPHGRATDYPRPTQVGAGCSMVPLEPAPCPHAIRTLELLLSAGRRQKLADTAATEAERDRHEIAAEMQRMAAERQAAQITRCSDE